MPEYWLTMLDEENFKYTVERGIYGLPESASGLAQLIKPGHRLVAYVMKKGCRELCQSFAAVLEIAGEWRKSTKPIWPDEREKGIVLYPWVVDVRVLAKGRVEFSKVKERLEELLGRGLDAKRLRLYALYYAKRPLPPGVGEFLEEELRKGQVTEARGAEFTHEDLLTAVVEVGRWLDFRVEREYHIDNFSVDAAFFKPPRATPFAVVEVHVGGDIYKDLAALKHAYDRYGSKLIYVLAGDEKAVARLLDGQGAFHEIREHVAVIRAEELLKLREALRLDGARRLLKWLELVK